MRWLNLSDAVVNAQADVLGKMLDGGYLYFFSGVPPLGPDEPLAGQTCGVVLSFAAPAFEPAIAGVIRANALGPGIVQAHITATWARAYRADARTAVLDISAGERDACIILPSTNFIPGALIGVESFEHTVARTTG